jgi:hypothetical protein
LQDRLAGAEKRAGAAEKDAKKTIDKEIEGIKADIERE